MLKDLGHSTYSFGKSLLNQDNYIDASGLVVLRHAIGEVILLFYYLFQGTAVGRNVGRNVLCMKCEAHRVRRKKCRISCYAPR